MVTVTQHVTSIPDVERQKQYMERTGWRHIKTEQDPADPQGYFLTFEKVSEASPEQIAEAQRINDERYRELTQISQRNQAQEQIQEPNVVVKEPFNVIVPAGRSAKETINQKIAQGYTWVGTDTSQAGQTTFSFLPNEASQENYAPGIYTYKGQNIIVGSRQAEAPAEWQFEPMSIWTPQYKGEGYVQVGTGRIFKPIGFSTPQGELLEEIPIKPNLGYEYEVPTPAQQKYLGTVYGMQQVFPKPTLEQQRKEWAYNTAVEQFAHSNKMIPAQFLDLGFGDWFGFKTASIGIGGFATGEKPEITAEKIINVRRDYARYSLGYAQSEGATSDFMTNLLAGKSFIRGATSAFLPATIYFGTAGAGGTVGKMIFGGFMGYQSYETAKNPTPENIGALVIMGGLAGAGYLGSKLSYPKIKLFTGEKAIEIPTSEGAFTWKGLGIEYKTAGRPLIGVTKQGIEIGSPKWNIPRENIAGQYTPFSATESYIARRTINLEGYENVRIASATDVMKITQNQPSAFVRKQFIRETTTLSPKGTDVVLRFAKQEQADLYGSFVARSQMPESLGITKKMLPEEYAYFLQQIGKIKYKPIANIEDYGRLVFTEPKPTIIIGTQEEHFFGGWSNELRTEIQKIKSSDLSYNLKYQQLSQIANKYSSLERMSSISHELIHYNQPKALFNIEELLHIPYKLQPSEIIAHAFESPYKTFEAKVPTKIGRVPHDIDLQLNVGGDMAQVKTQQLFGRLQLAGENVRINPETPTLIESFKGGQWVHAVDIHAKGGDPFLAGSKTIEGGWGFKFDQTRSKIEGIKVMRLSEQGLRKGVSTMGISKRGIYPEPHRFKDIGDFIDVQETLIMSREKAIFKNPMKTARARSMLEQFKGTYSEAELRRMGKSPVIKLKIYSGTSKSASTRILSPSAFVVVPRSFYSPSVRSSMRPSRSISYGYYVSKSVSPSRSMSTQLSRSVSAKTSQSVSAQLSRSISASMSMRPSRSIYYSPAFSRSLSPYLSRSPSPYRYRSPSRSPYPSSPPYRPPSRRFFMAFNFDFGQQVIKYPEPRQSSRNYSYMPDLYSYTAGITSFSMPSTLSGFAMRPMIVGRRKRKKRR